MDRIGVDGEWNPAIHSFQEQKIALLQVGNEDQVFLFDMIKMVGFEEFNVLMTAVFQNVMIIGLAFNNDTQMLKKEGLTFANNID